MLPKIVLLFTCPRQLKFSSLDILSLWSRQTVYQKWCSVKYSKMEYAPHWFVLDNQNTNELFRIFRQSLWKAVVWMCKILLRLMFWILGPKRVAYFRIFWKLEELEQLMVTGSRSLVVPYCGPFSASLQYCVPTRRCTAFFLIVPLSEYSEKVYRSK